MDKTKVTTRLTLVFVLLVASMSVFAESRIKPFISGSFSQIIEQRKNKTFVLVLWSVDCPPCYKELKMLGEFVQQHAELDLVLVSTDIEATEDELITVLKKYKLDNLESWIFRGESDERLRYEIDRTWYGELPRSYLFKEDVKKQVVSGVLSEDKILLWMKN